jgi:hypothetical protein
MYRMMRVETHRQVGKQFNIHEKEEEGRKEGRNVGRKEGRKVGRKIGWNKE